MGEYPALSEEDIAVIALQRQALNPLPVVIEYFGVEQWVAW